MVDIWSIFGFFWWSIFDKTPLAALLQSCKICGLSFSFIFGTNMHFCLVTGYVANMRFLVFFTQIWLTQMQFDSDFTQISGQKNGEWSLCFNYFLFYNKQSSWSSSALIKRNQNSVKAPAQPWDRVLFYLQLDHKPKCIKCMELYVYQVILH